MLHGVRIDRRSAMGAKSRVRELAAGDLAKESPATRHAGTIRRALDVVDEGAAFRAVDRAGFGHCRRKITRPATDVARSTAGRRRGAVRVIRRLLRLALLVVIVLA